MWGAQFEESSAVGEYSNTVGFESTRSFPYWGVLAQHVGAGKLFGFLWDSEDYPLEAALCWSTKGRIRTPRYQTQNLLQASIDVEAQV